MSLEERSLFNCVKSGDLCGVEKIINLNPNFVHITDDYKYTPLHWAIKR